MAVILSASTLASLASSKTNVSRVQRLTTAFPSHSGKLSSLLSAISYLVYVSAYEKFISEPTHTQLLKIAYFIRFEKKNQKGWLVYMFISEGSIKNSETRGC